MPCLSKLYTLILCQNRVQYLVRSGNKDICRMVIEMALTYVERFARRPTTDLNEVGLPSLDHVFDMQSLV